MTAPPPPRIQRKCSRMAAAKPPHWARGDTDRRFQGWWWGTSSLPRHFVPRRDAQSEANVRNHRARRPFLSPPPSPHGRRSLGDLHRGRRTFCGSSAASGQRLCLGKVFPVAFRAEQGTLRIPASSSFSRALCFTQFVQIPPTPSPLLPFSYDRYSKHDVLMPPGPSPCRLSHLKQLEGKLLA